MAALNLDNQDNAVLAVKIVFDLHRTFRSQLEVQAAPFLDFVIKVSTRSMLDVCVCVCVAKLACISTAHI